MPTYEKSNFAGGLNQQYDASKSDWDNTQRLVINGRSRRGTIEPIHAPIEITASLPVTSGLVQGFYTFDTYALIFINGAAYIRQFVPESSTWTRINDLVMSTTAPDIDVELIPQSTVNRIRTATSSTATVDLSSPVSPSPQCAIVCDGVSQSWIIFPDGSARITKSFSEWLTTDREYVPIMRFPTLVGEILYGMMKDNQGRFTQIVRSVSGRPLDFMVPVNSAGDRIGSVESQSGALATATSVSYNEATAMRAINSVDGAFLVTTLRSSTLVIPNYDILIYGEHTWRHQFLFNVGSVSQYAIADMLGDTAVVYPGGIRTFNGVEQSKFEGRNSTLSMVIQELFGSTQQVVAAAVEFDNYVGFGVTTVYGPGIVWWDSTVQRFVAVDLTLGVGVVKQFAAIVTPTVQRLFYRTDSGRVYEAFAGDPQRVTVLMQAIPANGDRALAIRVVNARFIRSRAAGFVECSVYSDGRLSTCSAIAIPAGDVAYELDVQPVPGPQAITQPDSTVASFEPAPDTAGRALLALSWNADAELSEVTVAVSDKRSNQNLPIVPTAPVTEIKLVFVGNDAVTTTDRVMLNDLIQKERADYVIGLGSHTADGSVASVDSTVIPYWDNLHAIGKFFATAGAGDLNVAYAVPLFDYLRQGPERWSRRTLGNFTELFLINDGLNSAGAQTESANSPTFATGSQMLWLQAALAESTAQHKIVVWHNPSRSSYTNGAKVALEADLTGASVLITGGPNGYERLVGTDDFIPRFTVGTGGQQPFGTISAIADGSQKIVNDTLGYLVAVIRPLSMDLTFKALDGTTRDRYRI